MRLFLCRTRLATLHQLGVRAMLPNWCRALLVRAFRLAQHDEYLRIHTPRRRQFHACLTRPLRAQRPTGTTTPRNPAAPAYMRARALPTNRHEGGSLT